MVTGLKSPYEACLLLLSNVYGLPPSVFQIAGDCVIGAERIASQLRFLSIDFDKYYYRKH